MSMNNSPKSARKLSAVKGSENSSTERLVDSLVEVDIASLDKIEVVQTTNALEVECVDEALVDFDINTLNENQTPDIDSLTESITTVENVQNENYGTVVVLQTGSLDEIETETVVVKSEGVIEIGLLDLNPKFKSKESKPVTNIDQFSAESSNGAENSIELDNISTLDIDLAEILEDPDIKSDILMMSEEGRNSKTFSPEAEVGQLSSDATDAPAEESVAVLDKEGVKTVDRKERKNSSPNQDVTARLEQELEQEMRYSMTIQKLRQVWELLPSKDPDTVLWSVEILKQGVKDLEEQMEILKREEGDKEDSEFRLRCGAQTELNKKLEEQISWYNGEVLKIRDKLKKGQEYTYDVDLDDMSEFELAKLVKVLERERNNLYGDLRSKSWLLDSQSKDYYHFKDLIKAYNGDLNHINRSLEHFWRQRNREQLFTGGSSPMTSPGSVKWNGEEGIQPTQRIIDPRKGPVRKTAGVRSLPRLDQEALENYDNTYNRKRRTKSMTSTRSRTKSMDMKHKLSTKSVPPRSEDSTSAEPTSEPSEDFTVESFTSSGI